MEIIKANRKKKFDWKNFDINKPLEQYPIGSMPVKIDDGEDIDEEDNELIKLRKAA